MNFRPIRFLAFAIIIGLTSPGLSVMAAADNSSLLRLVGDNAGAVIEIDNLQDNRKTLTHCEVVTRLQETEVFRRWKAGGDFQKLVVAQKVIEQLVGQPLGEFVDDVFGQSIVVAVYPKDSTNSDVVVLTEAVASAALENAIDAWNRADRAEISRIPFGGTAFVRRTRNRDEKKPLPPQFYFRSENVLAFSNSETEIRRVITLHTKSAERSFLNSVAFRESSELPVQRMASLYLNPRAWDDQVLQGADESKGAKYLSDLWKRCDSIAFGLSIDELGIVVKGTAYLREPEEKGKPKSESSRETNEKSRNKALPVFLSQVPRRAVAMLAGEHDLASLSRLFLSSISSKDLEDWNRMRGLSRGLLVGFDFFDDVLPALRNNWGAYVVATQGARVKQSPLDAVVGLELPPPGEITHGKVTMRDALDNALQTALRVIAKRPAAADANNNAEVISTSTLDEINIRSVDSGRSIQPAFALTSNHLLISTSPVAIQECLTLHRRDALSGDPQFRAMASVRFPHENHLAYINANALRHAISANESLFASRLGKSRNKTKDDSLNRIRTLNDTLRSFDAVFFASRRSGRRLFLSAGIVVNSPVDE